MAHPSSEKARLRRWADDAAGASALELTLCLVLLVVTAIGIIDLARYLAVRGMLEYGAHRGLDLATKIGGLMVDPRPCSSWSPAPPACDDTVQAANQVLLQQAAEQVRAEARRVPIRTLVGDIGSDSGVYLTAVEVVRGGEAAHPLQPLCYDVNAPEPRPAFNGFQGLRLHCPLMVELRGRVKMLLPLLGELEVRGVAFGFREDAVIGSVPPAPTPAASATPTPVGPLPTPTNTPVPTATPTPCGAPNCDDPQQALCCSGGEELECEWEPNQCSCNCEVHE